MRVIAGKARRLLLKTIDGLDTRPTTDRIKETLFNMINSNLVDCCFLDLFSGSGAIGIEALSRGAKQAVFVEQNSKAAECIDMNLQTTKLKDLAVLMNCDALAALRRLEERKYVFDYVFMDPPYNQGLERQVLAYLSQSLLIDQDSTIIIEAALDTKFDYLGSMGYVLQKDKMYKTNRHVFVVKENLDEKSRISGEL